MAVENIGNLVLYKNNQLIALHKPAGMAVQDDPSQDVSLMQLAEIYCKKKLRLIHRIDRPASGLVLFAKSASAAAALSEQFQNRSIQKHYLALTKNALPDKEGQLHHHLSKNSRNNKSIAHQEAGPQTKEAKLHYQWLGKSDFYHLWQIELLTGRHHQIRAQLAAMDCPIKGDVKYGARRRNPDRSIHLHAWKLQFEHPTSGESVLITAPPPDEAIWKAFAEVLS
ncbi:MAG: RNA pseudouridine synthase [Bacteroidota bacterium]